MKASHAAVIIIRAIVATSMFVGLGIAFAAWGDRRTRPAAYPFATPHNFQNRNYYNRDLEEIHAR